MCMTYDSKTISKFSSWFMHMPLLCDPVLPDRESNASLKFKLNFRPNYECRLYKWAGANHNPEIASIFVSSRIDHPSQT